MTTHKLQEILQKHKDWVYGNSVEKANLTGADLRGANLRGANLTGANLTGADLTDADLTDAYLTDADLTDADLTGANLTDADLTDADLRGANLRGANLTGANLTDADLTDAKYKTLCVGYNLSCPEKGAFIGFKKLCDDKIATLLILEDAKRSSATTRKCRCDKALVLEIKKNNKSYKTGYSQHDGNFKYTVGEEVSVDDFDEDRWNECSTGIHFFITKEEAEEY